MPIQKKVRSKKETSRCRKTCLKKYMKPNLEDYQGTTFAEKVDYCISAHYACCKPDKDKDRADQKDIWEECREKISKSSRMKGGDSTDV